MNSIFFYKIFPTRFLLPALTALFLLLPLKGCDKVAGGTTSTDNPEITISVRAQLDSLGNTEKIKYANWEIFQANQNPLLNPLPLFKGNLDGKAEFQVEFKHANFGEKSEEIHFNILVRKEQEKGGILQGLKFSSGRFFQKGQEVRDTLILSMNAMRPFPDSSQRIKNDSLLQAAKWLVLPGTPFYSVIENEKFQFPALPRGEFSLQFLNAELDTIVSDSLKVTNCGGSSLLTEELDSCEPF